MLPDVEDVEPETKREPRLLRGVVEEVLLDLLQRRLEQIEREMEAEFRANCGDDGCH
jgi:hypothetical protein